MKKERDTEAETRDSDTETTTCLSRSLQRHHDLRLPISSLFRRDLHAIMGLVNRSFMQQDFLEWDEVSKP